MITAKPVTTPMALHSLADQVGNFIEYWGFKKIHGIIWTHLYLSKTPLSAQELIARLKISKALVSVSMKDLLHYRLILQTDETLNKKNKFYVANPEVFSVIRGVLEAREKQMLKRIASEFRALQDSIDPSSTTAMIDQERLTALGKMIGGANAGLQSFIHLTHIDLKIGV